MAGVVASRPTNMARKEKNRSRSLTGWVSRDFCQYTIQAHKGIRGNDASLRGHPPHTVEDKHECKTRSRRRHDKNGKNGVRAKQDKCKG